MKKKEHILNLKDDNLSREMTYNWQIHYETQKPVNHYFAMVRHSCNALHLIFQNTWE